MENSNIVKNLYTPVSPSKVRRVAAFILDFICVLVVAVGFGLLFSYIFRYDVANYNLDMKYLEHGLKYYNEAGELEMISTDVSNIEALWNSFYNDPLAVSYYQKLVDYSLLLPTLSITCSMLIFELLVPLLMKHGRTIGYYVFKIALISYDGLEINTISLVIRGVIGKIVISTLIPIYMLLLIALDKADIWVGLIFLVIFFVDSFLVNKKPKYASIADRIARVYPCDYEGQVFVKTIDELNELKNKVK